MYEIFRKFIKLSENVYNFPKMWDKIPKINTTVNFFKKIKTQGYFCLKNFLLAKKHLFLIFG